MDLSQKENYIRANRQNEFKYFDAIAIRYLSQGLEIPSEWKVYATALRNMTDNVDEKVELLNGMWVVHWPPQP